MKNHYLIISFFLILSTSAFSTSFTVTTSGFTYSPAVTNAAVGDTIFFPGSGLHPIVQTDFNSWTNNMTVPLSGGWGVQNTNFMHVITSADNIYFICQNHGGGGMKGQIVVTPSSISETVTTNTVKLQSTTVSGKFITVINGSGLHGELQVYELSGKLASVHSITNEVSQQISIDLNKGIFLYRFNMEGNKTTATERLYVGFDLH
jgi:plastocyanin